MQSISLIHCHFYLHVIVPVNLLRRAAACPLLYMHAGSNYAPIKTTVFSKFEFFSIRAKWQVHSAAFDAASAVPRITINSLTTYRQPLPASAVRNCRKICNYGQPSGALSYIRDALNLPFLRPGRFGSLAC